MDEQRRYFPDWIECLPARLPELEADHNSYLAGGYADAVRYPQHVTIEVRAWNGGRFEPSTVTRFERLDGVWQRQG